MVDVWGALHVFPPLIAVLALSKLRGSRRTISEWNSNVTFCYRPLLEFHQRYQPRGLIMNFTHHAGQRMNQRGISRRLVEFALRHGRLDGNRHVLDRKESLRVIEALNEELRLAKQALDKGGVTVVDGEGAVITTYNLRRHVRHRSARGGRGPG
jgi:hypothetical protein